MIQACQYKASLETIDEACHLHVGLLSVFMTRLEDGVLDRSEETFRSVSGFLSLLQCFRGDMHPDFQRALVGFFCGRFAKLQDMRYNTLPWACPLVYRPAWPCSSQYCISKGLKAARWLKDGEAF